MKKLISSVLAFLMMISLSVYVAPLSATADESGSFGGGSWDYDLQGYRFSVFDYENHSVLSVLDVIRNNSSGRFKQGLGFQEFWDRNTTPTIPRDRDYYGIGCKLQYIDIYNSLNNGEGITAKKMKDSLITSQSCNYGVWLCGEPSYYDVFVPIEVDLSQMSDKNYIARHRVTKKLLTKVKGEDGEMKASPALMQIITKLGFYFDIDGYEPILALNKELIPFEDNYVLVAEPVYWFRNRFRTDKRIDCIYGTPTEWAIYDQKVSDVYHVNGEGGSRRSGYGIHSVMGNLTYKAGPVSCMTMQEKNFGDYHFDAMKTADPYYKKIYNEKSVRVLTFDEVDDLIIRTMGFDVMTKTQIAQISLTIDINKTNTTFRPDTDAVVSFKISQSEEYSHKFCPSYDDVGTGGAFGIKLTLTTLSFRDDNGANVPIPPEFAEPIEILCDGLPAQAAKTLAYKTVHMPEQTGTWRFELTVETNEPSVVNDGEKELSFTHKSEYFTNTSADGEKKTAKKFTYEITIQDPTEQYLTPPDTTANDGAAGFEIPDAYESMYTASSPVTELSWKYLRAVQKKDNLNDLTVDFVEVSDSAKASMDRQYLPCSYGNIPSAKSAENSADGLLHTRSGYGIGIKYSMLASKGYFQNGFVLYPEFDYDGYADKLEYTRSGAYVNYTLAQNEYSMYKNTASSDYSRVHFTPVWYPDGDYNIIVYMYDCWTPVGMLWDSAVFTIKLSGSVYDDWYITRR